MKTFFLTSCALTSLLIAFATYASPTSSLVHADTPNPDAILAQYPNWVLGLLCESNAYANANPTPGKTIRFQTPVEINLNGVPQVREAMQNIQAMTSGAVTFKIVDSIPKVGIIVVAGDALTRDGLPGLGHVTGSRNPQSAFGLNVQGDGFIDSQLYIHLGSAQRDYIQEGFHPYSLAEHELAHALGLAEHFPGFTGIEGITMEPLVTLTALYRIPPGTDVSRFCKSE